MEITLDLLSSESESDESVSVASKIGDIDGVSDTVPKDALTRLSTSLYKDSPSPFSLPGCPGSPVSVKFQKSAEI